VTEIVVHIDELVWEHSGPAPRRLAGLIESSLSRQAQSPGLPSGDAETHVSEAVAATIRQALGNTQV
jgi:hypothetical protein